ILIDAGDTAHRPKSLGFALAHVPPTFAGIEALDHAAFFNRTIHDFRIFWMNGNSFDVRDVGWGRIAPLFSPRELPHAVQLRPSLSSVGTSKKQRRLRARIDSHSIGRVEFQRKYLVFLQSLKLPGFSPVGAFVDAAFSAGQETPFVTWA